MANTTTQSYSSRYSSGTLANRPTAGPGNGTRLGDRYFSTDEGCTYVLQQDINVTTAWQWVSEWDIQLTSDAAIPAGDFVGMEGASANGRVVDCNDTMIPVGVALNATTGAGQTQVIRRDGRAKINAPGDLARGTGIKSDANGEAIAATDIGAGGATKGLYCAGVNTTATRTAGQLTVLLQLGGAVGSDVTP